MAINDPRDISGLVAWYSPQYEAANYTDGQEMTTITDLSGNANHGTCATVDTAKPLWKSTGGPSGGAQRFRFEAGGYFTLPSGVMGSASAGEIMYMIKGDYTGNTTVQGFHHFGTSTSSNHWPYQSDWYDDFGSTVRKDLVYSHPTETSWRRITTWSASNDWSMYADGTEVHTYTTNTVGWKTVPSIGNSGVPPSSTSNQTFEGDYGAIVLYNKKLSTTERDDLVTWMAANPSGGR